MTKNKETMRFEAETKQLLELMIHSLYSNKEVFLRELISNASDALDKLRFDAIVDPTLAPEGFEGRISLEVGTEERALTIHDNGIGMSRDEIVSNIGTIARSGTQELLHALEKSKAENIPTELIGQFGVGFYSCFMAADRVVLTSRRAGEDTATTWEYSGDGEYSISQGSREHAGTSITLYLKEADPVDGLEDFTAATVLKKVVVKYSDFVRYPIVLGPIGEDGKEETLNSMKAIWLKSATEVTDEDRTEFYKHISRDWAQPSTYISMRAEGRLEYQALLFVPSHAPFDLFSQTYSHGLQLYVRNVKIVDDCEELLPPYLRFVKGVVDAQDLPLNVSREILQNNRQIAAIRQALTKKVIEHFNTMKEKQTELYTEVWNQFGAAIKEGIAVDTTNRDRLTALLLFQSSAHETNLTSLSEYVERMGEDQEEIYFLAGEARQIVEQSPHLEAFTKRGYEVLFLTDPVDEFMIANLEAFNGKKLRSVGKGEVDLGGEVEKLSLEEKAKSFDKFLEAVKKELDDHVKEVRLTGRLTSSPACLVGSEEDLSPHIERLMRANKMQVPVQKRILEINPDHDVIAGMKAKFDVNPLDTSLAETARLLHGQALLSESSPLPDPVGFAALVAKLMVGK